MDRLTSLRDKLHTAFRSKSEGAEAAAAEAAAPTRAPIAHEVFSESCPAAGKSFYTDAVVLQRGLTFLKGRLSTAQVFGTTQPDIVPGKYEGGLKLWECTIDLIETLRREIQDGRLSFRGKHVLELGCGHGLPGILACTKGAAVVHFQDFNEEVLLHLTIPNVHVNMASAKAKMAATAGNGSVKPSWCSPEIRFFAGDWADLGVGSLLSTIPEGGNSSEPASQPAAPLPLESSQSAPVTLENVKFAVAAAPSSSTGSLSRLGDIATVETPSNSSAVEIKAAMQGPGYDDAGGGHVKLDINSNTDKDEEQRSSSAHARVHVTGTPAFYKQTSGGVSGGEEEEAAPVEAGYDILLMSETIYCMESYPKLLGLVRKVLRSPYGVMYVAGKKHYFGVGGGTRQFKNFVEEDGYLHSHLVAEFADGASNVREIWKFFFRKSD